MKILHLKEDALLSYCIRKHSIDARKKPDIYEVYTIDVNVKNEKQVLKKCRDKHVVPITHTVYHISPSGFLPLKYRPVVIGSGPAGLFCALSLSSMGYRPILLERGMSVEERIKDVDEFWRTGRLKPNSNVQFGEGGAGTFSDGKLNTLIKDKEGRGRRVLELLVQHGAPKEILYQNKPHIGTDILADVVRSMREQIITNGGEVRFHTQVLGLVMENGQSRKQVLKGLSLIDTVTGKQGILETDIAILAIGHSARDTFSMLYESGLVMESKSFAIGVRVEHPQAMIDKVQYGKQALYSMPAASYKLAATLPVCTPTDLERDLPCGRGVYTFCMCPGGYVVNASSEEGRLCVNGMSYHSRDGANANSAVIVTVTQEDFGDTGPLAGIRFQQMLEERAYAAGNGRIPVQLLKDFREGHISKEFGEILPQTKGEYTFADVRGIFPAEIAGSIEKGILTFDRKISGFAREDTLLLGVESRTSSPVRIVRDAEMESSLPGLYPCGEGAGYAGGITSAAMDGMKTAEAIARKYHPFDNKGE